MSEPDGKKQLPMEAFGFLIELYLRERGQKAVSIKMYRPGEDGYQKAVTTGDCAG